METATATLIEALDRERKQRQMSDRKFSTQVLGISPAYWCLLKSGGRPLTPNLAVLFMQKLPALTPEVTNFIVHQGNDGQNENQAAKTGVSNPSGIEECMPEGLTPQKTPQNRIRR